MRRNFTVFSVLVLLTLFTVALPTVASAQYRGHVASRVVVVHPGYYGYAPYWDPFFSVGYQWGYPYGYPPYYGYRIAGPEASLRFEVKPKDAKVYVDGYFAGVVDDYDGTFQRLHVTPGQHEIALYKEGFRTVRERLYLSPDSTRKLTHDLEPLAAGEANEPPPAPAPEIQPAPGPEDQDPAGPPPRRSSRRGQYPPPQARQGEGGSVAIRVQPEDAEVLIDGEPWSGDPGAERLVVQLTEGRHQVEVRKPGFRSVTLEVLVRPGETAPVNISLTPQ